MSGEASHAIQARIELHDNAADGRGTVCASFDKGFPVQIVEVLLTAFGGTAAALILVGFLGKAVIAQWLARELEELRSQLKFRGEKLVRDDERQFALAQTMRRYQGPLMHAAYDLQSRLYNVLVNRFFFVYLIRGTPSQQQYAQRNTAFLIAQYFGWTEIIRQQVQFIDFPEDEKTRRLSELRDEIYSLWQTDRFSDPLMIWAGDQRALGELMIEVRGDELTCKGYANFLKSFDASQEPLMDQLMAAVSASAQRPDAVHDRLAAVQRKLIEMLDVLDPAQLRFRAEKRVQV